MKSDIEFTAGVISKAAGARADAALALLAMLSVGAVPSYLFYRDAGAGRIPAYTDKGPMQAEMSNIRRELRNRRQYGSWL